MQNLFTIEPLIDFAAVQVENIEQQELRRLDGMENSEDKAFTELESTDTSQKIPKKKIIITAILCLLPVVLIFGWCIIMHLNGNKCMVNNDFDGAITYYQSDFLFGRKKHLEAKTGKLMQDGEIAFQAGQYEEAIECFRAAEDTGKDRLNDALYELAKKKLEKDQVNEAIDLFAQTTYDSTTLLDAYFHEKGNAYFNSQKYTEAKETYGKCIDDSIAKENAAILEQVLNHDFYNAALRTDEALRNDKSDISRNDWYLCFACITDSLEKMEEAVTGELAKTIVSGEKREFKDLSEVLSRKLPKQIMLDKGTEYLNGYKVESLDELYQACGEAPAGKYLILLELKNQYTLAREIMRCLPADMLPASLEEVEYIVLLEYDYNKTGAYYDQFGLPCTNAIRESARVTVLRMPGQKRVYQSHWFYGEKPPSSISVPMFGKRPAYYSLGAPAMGGELYKAIDSVLKTK